MRAEDLAVVIPTRGRPDVLKATLAGLARQTATGFQTIVVFDGEPLRELPSTGGPVTMMTQASAGPGVARNRGVEATERPLLLFLGADMVPAADLIERHLDRHAAEPRNEVAVLGRARWHPDVAGTRVARWMERSGAQFDYRQLERETGDEAGFGRFYSCNVSLGRELFLAAGGFDPEFVFDYEDLDLAWRLHEQGMVLRYEPLAVTWHLHRYDLAAVEARYRTRAQGEYLMSRKHAWFSPWFHERLVIQAARPPVSRVWPAIADRVPERLPGLRHRVEDRADRWYQQRLAVPFLIAWEGERDLEELRAYLGSDYDRGKLERSVRLVDEEAAMARDEGTFYRTSRAYLYDLTVFAMSGTKQPYHRAVQRLAGPGARLLDYGCGIGSDGLRLLQDGFRVEFADYDNPSTQYLRWRLERRGLQAPVHDLDVTVPGGFDLAYAFDVLEHLDDPFGALAELERRAGIVLVNLLAPVAGDTPLHRALPVQRILAHAERRGLLLHRRHHDRVHLVAYRGDRGPEALPELPRAARLRSAGERWLGPLLGHRLVR